MKRIRWSGIAALIALATGTANADRRETSVHAHLVSGISTRSDPAADESGTAPLGGLAVRASYATSDLFQYDVAVSLLATGGASFPTATFAPPGRPQVTGPYTISSQLTRLDAGVTFRLGVAWIPTVRLAAGVQGRRSAGPVVMDGGREVTGEDILGRGPELGLDVVGLATVGVDHRVNRRLIIGASVGASLAVPIGGESFRTIEGTIHAAYYWYRR